MVKCSDCGYLASRNVQSRLLEETEQEIRKEGSSVEAINTGKPMDKYEPPICFMRSTEYKSFPLTVFDEYKDAIRSEIQRERDCNLFTLWQQGFTPKEHREMIDREWMQKREDERRKDERAWQTKQGWQLAMVAGIFTIIGGFITWLLTRGGN